MSKIVTLGEILLRLSTEVGTRLENSPQLKLNYGGAEANVAISLANYGHDVQFMSKVPNNSLGKGALKFLRSYNVSCEPVLVGGNRLGIYYLETGASERGHRISYDRQHSSFSEMSRNEWATQTLFDNVEVFHISGITPALSLDWQELILTLIQQAKSAGAKISLDINFRENLWSQSEAKETLTSIMPQIDYCSAGTKDMLYLLDILGDETTPLNQLYEKLVQKYPNLTLVYSTKRKIYSSSHNELIGTLYYQNQYLESKVYEMNPIVDRVGGGDAFSSGILHGILSELSGEKILQFATAAAVLKHTVSGDENQFSEEEVWQFATSNNKEITR